MATGERKRRTYFCLLLHNFLQFLCFVSWREAGNKRAPSTKTGKKRAGGISNDYLLESEGVKERERGECVEEDKRERERAAEEQKKVWGKKISWERKRERVWTEKDTEWIGHGNFSSSESDF